MARAKPPIPKYNRRALLSVCALGQLLGVQQLSLMRFNRDLAPHAEMLNNDTARKEKQYVWANFQNGGGFRFSNTNLFFCSESVCEDIFWDG